MRRLPQLSTQQLDYLVAVADSDTWAEAATSRGVSPSALSQGLAELERRLGAPLFDREGRRRVITPGAQPILDYARSVVAQTTDLGHWIDGQQSGSAGQVRVGMIDAAAVDHFSDQLRGFRESHPTVDFHLNVGPSTGLLEALRAATIDLAIIVRPDVDPPDVDLRKLLTESLGIYAPPTTSIGPVASWGPWVLFPSGSHTRSLIEERLSTIGASVEVSAESHQPEVLKEMVRLGLGWTVLPVVQAERAPGALAPARAKPLASRELVAATRRGASPNPLSQVLIDAFLAADPVSSVNE